MIIVYNGIQPLGASEGNVTRDKRAAEPCEFFPLELSEKRKLSIVFINIYAGVVTE